MKTDYQTKFLRVFIFCSDADRFFQLMLKQLFPLPRGMKPQVSMEILTIIGNSILGESVGYSV